MAPLKPALGEELGIDHGDDQSYPIDPTAGGPDEPGLDTGMMGDEDLTRQHREQVCQHGLQVFALCRLVVGNLMDDRARRRNGTRNPHQPMLGGAQVDGAVPQGHMTNAEDGIPTPIKPGGLQVDGEELNTLPVRPGFGKSRGQIVPHGSRRRLAQQEAPSPI